MINKIYEKYHIFFAFLAFLILTCLWTYPVIFKFTSEVPKWGSDVYQALGQSGRELLVLQNLGIWEGFLSLLKNYQINIFAPYAFLSLFFNNITAYNILFFESFVLSGLGMYLLALYFTKNKLASFIAGIIFAFAPFHFYQSMSVNLGTMHQEWIPFFVLFLFKFFEEFKIKFFLLSTFLFLLIALTEHQLLAFTSIFVLLFLIFRIITQKSLLKNKRFWIFLSASGAILFGIANFLFAPLLKIASSEENFLDAGMGQAVKYSANFLDPFVPAQFNSLWGSFGSYLHDLLLNSRDKKVSYFIGYVVLFLIGYLIYVLIKNRKERIKNKFLKNSHFWLISTFIFYILSLGPAFKIFDKQIFLPYYLIYKYIPFFENIRTTGRFFVYVMLSVAILASIGLKIILEKYPKNKTLVFSSVIFLIFVEFTPIPLSTEKIYFSPFYEKLGVDKEFYKILEIPGSTSGDFASFEMITANIHKKELANGMPLTRVIPGQFSLQRTTPIISQLLYSLPSGKKVEEISKPDIFANSIDGAEILTFYNIRYIIIDKKFINSDKKISNINNFIEKNLSVANIYEDAYIKAFEIKKVTPTGFFTILQKNWGDKKTDSINNIIYRKLEGDAEMKIVNMSNSTKDLFISFDLRSANQTSLKISLNNQNVLGVKIGNLREEEKFSIQIPPGESILKFVPEDTNTVIEISNIVFTGEK